MPVADDVVWLDVLPSMNRFRPELERQAGGAASSAGEKAGGLFSGGFAKHLKIGAAIGGAMAVAAGGKFLKDSIAQASDLNESLNAVQVTFGSAAGGIMDLGKQAAQSVGLSNTEFNSLAVQFSAFATTIAGPGGDVVSTMKDLTTRGSDFASVMNLDVNEAMGLFQSGLAGETEPLRKYGIDLSAAAVGNYALSHGITDNAATMTEAQKVQARYAYLMEQTSKVQGDFGNTSDQLANSQRILGARWDNIQAMVGAKVLPVLTELSGWALNTGLPAFMAFGGWIRDHLGPIFSNVVDFFSGSFLPTAKDLAQTVLPALWGAFQTVGDVVSKTVGFFTEHEGAAKALGITVGVVGAFIAAAWVAQATVSTVNAAKSVIAWFTTAGASTTSATIQSRSTAQIVVGWLAASAAAIWNGARIALVWTAQIVASAVTGAASFVVQVARVVAGWVLMGAQSLLQAARMAAAWFIALGPLGWVIAAVVGLVALIIANWDTVKRVTIDVWNAVVKFVKDAASAIWQWVTDRFNALKDGVVTIFNATKAAAVAVWNAFRDAVVAGAQFIWDWVVRIFNFYRDAVVLVFTTIKNVVVGIWNAFRDAIIAAAQFIWDRAVAIFGAFRTGVELAFTTIKNTVVAVWNGFRDTIVQGAQNIWTWVVDRFNGLKNGAVSVFTSIRDTIGSIWDGIQDKIKTPLRIVFNFVNDRMIGPVNDILAKFPGGLKIPTLPRLATGGLLRGPGTGTSDSILGVDPRTGIATAAVSNGEFVVRKKQTDRFLPLLRAINDGTFKGLARGGLAGAFGVNAYGLGDLVEGAKNIGGALIDKAVNAASTVKNFATDMLAKGARKAAELVLGPIRDAAKSLIPGDKVPFSLLTAGIDKLYDAVMGKGDEQDKLQASLAGGSFTSSSRRTPNGVGGLGPVAAAARLDVMKRFGLTNIGGYSNRNIAGTNTLSDHATGHAIDVMIPNYKSAAGIAKGNAVASYFTGEGAGRYPVKYVIWRDQINSGSGWKPYGHPGGGRSDTLQHRDHDHVSFFDQGGLWKSGVAGINLTGGVERVLTPPQDNYFRKFVDLNERRGSDLPPVHLYTPDIPHAMRALRAEQQEREALAPTW